MKFQSITMNNFMRYKGQNVIEFSCDEKRNVTVVLGDNTVGKTTIAPVSYTHLTLPTN